MITGLLLRRNNLATVLSYTSIFILYVHSNNFSSPCLMCRCVELCDESALRLRLSEQRCSRTCSQSCYISAGEDVGEYLIRAFVVERSMNL